MTPAAYGTVKAQLKAREDGGWKRVAWSLARRPQLNELELVHARLITANPKVRVPCCLSEQASLALHKPDHLQWGFGPVRRSPVCFRQFFGSSLRISLCGQRFTISLKDGLLTLLGLSGSQTWRTSHLNTALTDLPLRLQPADIRTPGSS